MPLATDPAGRGVARRSAETPAAAPRGGGDFGFYRPDGTPLPSSPPLPEPDGGVDAAHDADITPDTIIPPWYGERLDLDYAIYVCFANAHAEEEKQADRNQDSDSATRAARPTVYEPEDWPERIRQYEAPERRRQGSQATGACQKHSGTTRSLATMTEDVSAETPTSREPPRSGPSSPPGLPLPAAMS